ncbi:MAG TPA: class I SAM-dependent methyltransferase, partial [Isosphaeraceae bacterium]|nr:class I SAM-dependent methyltransferase [Isosphaeraceae bacterium]
QLSRHDAAVRAAFDAQQVRFKSQVAADDARLKALLRELGPLDGRRVLDLGCGKGRFARHLQERGAEVIGLDQSATMLGQAALVHRVHGSTRRLPLADESFDAVIAIEVVEHLDERGLDETLAEIERVLRPGGIVAIIDKNAGALDARRPWLPSLAVKWIDERRGRWMYPARGPARERWFWPRALRSRLAGRFTAVRCEHILSRMEAEGRLFRTLPSIRLMTLWTARRPGGRIG